MTYYDDPQPTPDGQLGQRIYHEALADRRGFRPDQIGIPVDDTVWAEIFAAIGRSAREMQAPR